MGVRVYLPANGQFTSPDPILGGNANPYTYPNDPINHADLTGRCGFAGISCTGWIEIGSDAVLIADIASGLLDDGASEATVPAVLAWRASLLEGATAVEDTTAVTEAVDAGSATNKILSHQVLKRMAADRGPYHNFPSSFQDEIFSNGTRTTVRNFFKQGKPNLSNDSIQYRLPGELNGRSGSYEIFTRPSISGRTELIMHYFFNPERFL